MDKKSRELVMAKLYFKNKDFKMAEKSFNEYLSMNPEDVAALKLLAQVYEQNKRYDKAFEMYERCYLAVPERTGVLLDICRILLMNEIWLNHVDYRKWLNLAIKAFPSNPIVVNFKAFLSTLPEDQHEFTSSSSPKESRSEDFIVKILDKLSLMESRLERIENKLNDQAQPQQSPAPVKQSSAPVQQSPVPSYQSPAPLQQSSVPLYQSPAPLQQSSVPLYQPPAPLQQSPVPLYQPPAPLQQSPVPLYQPPAPLQQSPVPLFQSPAPLQQSQVPLQQSPAPLQQSPAPIQQVNTTTVTTLPTTNPPFLGSTFNFSSTSSSLGGNFFAEGLKKLNLPSEGLWTTQSNSSFNFSKPKEDTKGEEDGEDGGVVPNEELAIENTCDMEPIEIKTGEEDEDILFENRCKLFRLRDKEYKERGLGSIKVLKHKTTGKGRLIMRREAIGLVCLNCWDCSKIERLRENQIRWIGIDASDGEPEATIFLVKFKTKELTDTFMSHLTDLFLNDNDSTNLSASREPEVEVVDPKIDEALVNKARKLQLPDLFYHKLKNQKPCGGCNGCEEDD